MPAGWARHKAGMPAGFGPFGPGDFIELCRSARGPEPACRPAPARERTAVGKAEEGLPGGVPCACSGGVSGKGVGCGAHGVSAERQGRRPPRGPDSRRGWSDRWMSGAFIASRRPPRSRRTRAAGCVVAVPGEAGESPQEQRSPRIVSLPFSIDISHMGGYGTVCFAISLRRAVHESGRPGSAAAGVRGRFPSGLAASAGSWTRPALSGRPLRGPHRQARVMRGKA